MLIYRHHDYLSLLLHRIKQNKATPGYLSKLAKAAGMHLSYLSRVQKGEVQLTPDHAVGIAELWELNEEETDYFLNLVHRERAATPRLRKLIEQKLSAARRVHDLSGVAKKMETLPEQNGALFFTSWRYSAVHAALEIPALRKEEAIARHLNLAPTVVADTLAQLEQMGLAQRNGAAWRPAKNDVIFASAHSWQGKLYVRDWRLFAANRFTPIDETQFTYTGVFTLSRKDAARIRGILKDAATSVFDIKAASPDEELYLFAIDWLKI